MSEHPAARLRRRDVQDATALELMAMVRWLEGEHSKALHILRHEGYSDSDVRLWLRTKAQITDDFVLDAWSKLHSTCQAWCVETFGRDSHVH